MRSILPAFLRREEVELDASELVEVEEPSSYSPMTELDHFTVKTRAMIDGLGERIEDLDAEINRKIRQLDDLRRIKQSQELALRFMEQGH